jgi:hypothetical protein
MNDDLLYDIVGDDWPSVTLPTREDLDDYFERAFERSYAIVTNTTAIWDSAVTQLLEVLIAGATVVFGMPGWIVASSVHKGMGFIDPLRFKHEDHSSGSQFLLDIDGLTWIPALDTTRSSFSLPLAGYWLDTSRGDGIFDLNSHLGHVDSTSLVADEFVLLHV